LAFFCLEAKQEQNTELSKRDRREKGGFAKCVAVILSVRRSDFYEGGVMSYTNPNQSEGRIALRVNDAATASGLSRSTLYKLMAEGKLHAVKVAGRRLILMQDLQALLKTGAQQ